MGCWGGGQDPCASSVSQSLVLLFLKVCVWDAELRELRADCFMKEGEPRKAISDLKAAAKLKSGNTEAFYRISTLYYQLGDHELSLRSAPKTAIANLPTVFILSS